MLRFFLIVFVLLQAMAAFGDIKPIPYKPDPPITVDGLLDDWENVPFVLAIETGNHVVWKTEQSQWHSVKDLSAVIRMAWRDEGLYIAAQVKDDVFRNSGPGEVMFKGDHLELFIDTCPDNNPANKKFGSGQFQLSFSPGNLNDTRPLGEFGRINPEVYQYLPKPKSITKALVASQKTADGWNIEAQIGWDELGVSKPAKGNKFGIEVAISDSDSEQIQQEKLMMISTKAWTGPTRDRLFAVVLADSDGKIPAVSGKSEKIQPVKICKLAAIPAGKSLEKNFVISEIPEKSCTVLSIRSRLESFGNKGDTFAMKLALNGKEIDGKYLLNKTAEMETRDGNMIKIFSGSDGFRLPYASSFEQANLPYSVGNQYARFVSDEPRTDFKFDVTEFLHKGENTLQIGHITPSVKARMCLGDVQISFVPQTDKPQVKQLQRARLYYSPKQKVTAPINFQISENNSIKVITGKSSHVVMSTFSIPDGNWANSSNSFFTIKRTATQRDGVIVVTDNFKNLTNKNLGIIQRHEVAVMEKNAKYYLNGILRPFGLSGYYSSGNGTSYVELPAGGIGMLALSDEFSVHAQNYLLANGGIGLCDSNLVIGPGASYTAQWAIVSSDTGDYWNFINTMRRFLDVNFLINGSSACVQTYRNANSENWSVEQFRDFFTRKSAFYGISALTARGTYNGKKLDYVFNHGLAMLQADMTSTKAHYAKWRQAVPSIKILGYFHCFIDSSDYANKKFPKDKILSISGKQVEYGRYYYPLFFPTLTNQFGKAIEPIIDMYFNKLKADGIFWDEMNKSGVDYHYGSPWDNCSGDIDMNTHNVIALKSSLTLISKDWRLRLAKKILKRGYLVGNGVPACRAFRELKFPCFTETAQSTFAARQHLYSPIVLGDHLSEINEIDAYRNMLSGLDYGCVYYWYGDKVIPTYETLTSKMFPITPIRLGPGFIIGKERIITRISGFFGWNDASEHEVFFFDENGMPAVGRKVNTKIIDGKTFSEINLWPDWSAVILKNKEPI